MADQGYLLIATGAPRYLAMATACAWSLRHWDGRRPIHLLTDAGLAELADPTAFDGTTALPPCPPFIGCLGKLRAAEASPFAETMFVDADCLLLKGDMDRHWRRLAAGSGFAVPGEWRTTGRWYDREITDLATLVGLDRMAQISSGAIYFRGSAGTAVFALARELVVRLGDVTGHRHHGLSWPDEPYLALAASLLGHAPHPLRDPDNQSWHTPTINMVGGTLDAFSGRPVLVRPNRTLSPSLCHFADLAPRATYDAIVADFMAWAARTGGRAAPPAA